LIRQVNCGILSLLLSSLFSLFLWWIDLLDLAIPERVKRPLLALAVDLIGSFSMMEENWRAFGGRHWSE